MLKSGIGVVLTILSLMTLGTGVGNIITLFVVWLVGGNYEIGQEMDALQYAKGLAYSALALLLGGAMFWGGSKLSRDWRTALWIAALILGSGMVSQGISMSSEYVARSGVTVVGILLLLVGVFVLAANRLKAKKQKGVAAELSPQTVTSPVSAESPTVSLKQQRPAVFHVFVALAVILLILLVALSAYC